MDGEFDRMMAELDDEVDIKISATPVYGHAVIDLRGRLPGESVRDGIMRRHRENMNREFKNNLGKVPEAEKAPGTTPAEEPGTTLGRLAKMFKLGRKSAAAEVVPDKIAEGPIKTGKVEIPPEPVSSIPKVEAVVQGKPKDEQWIADKLLEMRTDAESKVDPELFRELLVTIKRYRNQTKEDVSPMSKTEMTPEEQAAADVAAYLTKQWEGGTSENLMLSAPASLTVLKDDGNYSKRPHIGGEEFRPTRAYVGKKGHMICCFEPVTPETYTEMQMPHTECLDKLSGYRMNVQENGTMTKLLELRKAKEEIQHQRDMKENSQKYGDFGAW